MLTASMPADDDDEAAALLLLDEARGLAARGGIAMWQRGKDDKVRSSGRL